jgi:uncharacterized protein (TIGR02231 family)
MNIGCLTLALVVVMTSFGSAAAQQPLKVKTKITAVTVYADRAQVTRTGKVDLGKAQGELVVTGLPGFIDQDSIRVALTPAAGRIVDVTSEVTHQAEATEGAVRKADAAVREISEKLDVLNDERQVIQEEMKQLKSIRAFTLGKLPRDMALRPIKPKTFGETIDFVSDRLRKALAALRTVNRKSQALQPELRKRQRTRSDLQIRAKLQHSKVTVGVTGSGRGKLTVTYLTPGATWEPVGELRTQGAETAELIQNASVVQTTGEDWAGAKLSFSTQRPGEMLKVPVAKALLMGGSDKGLGAVMRAKGSSFGRAANSYNMQNEIIFKNKPSMKQNFQRQMTIQNRAVASFAKLLKRGTTAHFVALSPRKVRADGKPVGVPIAKASFPLTARVVAVPEVSLNAVRTAHLLNSTEKPILPGKIALFVDGAFVGRTELSFVAPGEKFTVFLGVNDGLKLSRTLDRKRSSMDRGSKRTTMKVSFIVTAQNLSKKAVTLDLTDRVPAIQDEDIELDDVEIPKGAQRHSNGLVKWTAKLKAGQQLSWRVEYEVEYPNGLANRKRRKKGKKDHRRLQRNRSVPSMQEQIKDLEKKF